MIYLSIHSIIDTSIII